MAPSGRELSATLTEGECVTNDLSERLSSVGSFRHGFAVPPPSRREAESGSPKLNGIASRKEAMLSPAVMLVNGSFREGAVSYAD